MIGEEPADFDPELEAALSALDEALCAGRDTEPLERRVAELSGVGAAPLLSTLNALHDARRASRPHSNNASSARPPLVDPLADTRVDDAIPSTFGRFEILRRIGAGGSGMVFQARDPRLQRIVALKIPRAEILLSPDARRRFQREAELVAALNHPSIIPVFEAGDADGVPYIVEEYSSGTNLAEWLRQKRDAGEQVSCRDAAHLMWQVADALAEVHACGIVHRDLKPANVLLEDQMRAPGRNGNGDAHEHVLPRITDFGIAKLSTQDESLTATHAIVGTAAYMPPEQARGGTRDVGPAGDVYSLGVILYELLAGRRPFVDESDVRLLRRIVEDEPVRVDRLRRDVSRDLSAVCMKCLEKSPARRYLTAAELRDDLQRFLDGRPVMARPVSAVQRAVRWCRRRPVHTALLVVVSAAGIGGAAGTWFHIAELSSALQREKDLRTQTTELKALAEENLATAKSQGIALQRQLFCVDAPAAHRHLELGHGAEARALLDKYAGDAAITTTFTWRYLTRLCQLEQHVWDLGSQVYWVEFSPDGRRLVAGNEAGDGVMWDIETGSELFRLKGHTSCCNAVRFTPDGQRLWTASCDGTIRQWNAASGEMLETFAERGPDVRIETLALSPDGRLLAAGEDRTLKAEGEQDVGVGTLVLWDVEQRSVLADQRIGEKRLEALGFSDDGEQLAVASTSAASVFDVRTGLTRVNHVENVDSLFTSGATFLPQGRTIAWVQGVQGGDSWIALQESGASFDERRIPCEGAAATVAVDPAGRQVFVGTYGGAIEVRDLGTGARFGRLRQLLWGHAGRVCCLAVSRDGQFLASAGFDGTVRLWPIQKTEGSRQLVAENRANAVSFAADGTMLLVNASRKDVLGCEVRGYAVSDWSTKFEIGAEVMATSPDPRSSSFIGCSDFDNGNVFSADAATGAVFDIVRPNGEFGELHLALPRTPNLFYAAWQFGLRNPDRDAFVDEWSFDPPKRLRRLTTYSSGIAVLAVSDAFLAVARWVTGSDIEVIELATGAVRPLDGQYGATTALAFSPDGSVLAAANADYSLYLWEIASGRLVGALTGHSDVPRCLAFAPGGQELASGDESGMVRIWNLRSFAESLRIAAHAEPVRSIAFSPDGRMLATASNSEHEQSEAPFTGEVRVWSARDPAAR